MQFIRGLIDRCVLIGGVFAGGVTPSFLAQYRQRVGGQLTQVSSDLQPFRQIADRYHNGNLGDLIKHHLNSGDPTFYAEGAAIQAMMDAEARLTAAFNALTGDLWQQIAYMSTQADPAVLRATWEIYEPAFSFAPQSLALSAIAGISLWLAFLGSWFVIARIVRRPKKNSLKI